MASKVLTAKVKLNVSDAASKLSMLESRIKKIQNAINNNGSRNNLETQLNKQAIAAEKLKQATAKTLVAEEKRKQAIFQTQISEQKLATQKQRTNEATAKTALMQERVATQTQKTAEATTKAQIAEERLTAQIFRTQGVIDRYHSTQVKVKSKTNEIVQKVRDWASNQTKVTSSLRSTSSLLGSIKGKMTGLINTYLGVMGVKAMAQTSDTITGAQNKLNYLNAQESGGYNNKAFAATKESMDKMYVSAQKVRMGYSDMMSNVSKSMTLAGDAFQNNTDNAIRFQEVMAEAYAVGGASAAEMSSSMYQLIQALGAGTLAGDELRSVREGAPLAYKAIEEFAQGVYNTEESLKDLGSQGKITSDMVVAAILDSEGAAKELDEAFGHTAQTFDQTWTQIKNAATKAFEPISNMLKDMLNRAADNGLVEKFEIIFNTISKVIQIIFKVIENAVIWIADNWSWLQHVIVGGLILMASYFLITGAIAIANAIKIAIAWAIVHWQLLLVIVALAALLYAVYLWQQGAIDTCTLIAIAIGIISVLLFAFFGWQVALMVALLGLIFVFLEEVCGGAMWLVTALYNIASYITSFIFACIYAILAITQNILAVIVNLTVACGKSIMAIAENIGIAFQNAWTWAKNSFWEFLADVLDGVSKLEPVINGIASLIGKDGVDFGGMATSMRGRKSEYKSYVSVSDAWTNGMNTASYAEVSEAWSNGWNISERKDLSEAYDKGAKWGAGLKNSINDWGSGLAEGFNNKLSGLDGLGEKLGLDFGGMGNLPTEGVGGAYKQPDLGNLGGDVGDIAGNTGKMADSMELTEDDLKYLRDVANMEWKKEFTTATIKVDMSNYNTVNGDNDLDGIVTKLTDRLYEELQSVADGVYV